MENYNIIINIMEKFILLYGNKIVEETFENLLNLIKEDNLWKIKTSYSDYNPKDRTIHNKKYCFNLEEIREITKLTKNIVGKTITSINIPLDTGDFLFDGVGLLYIYRKSLSLNGNQNSFVVRKYLNIEGKDSPRIFEGFSNTLYTVKERELKDYEFLTLNKVNILFPQLVINERSFLFEILKN